ncbi:MAG: hypothetical protein QCI38_04395 [Candidatus Thermoplasmatota archaeon]|nr:hypothetical protein [Candidatus Thermoplasmatota archaeon]
MIAPGLLAIPVSAQTYTGTLVLSTGGVEKNYFEPTNTITFTVNAYEDGAPLQSSTVRIVVVGRENGEVLNITRVTDDMGVATYNWGAMKSIDLYTAYLNYSGSPLATVTFRVYNPVLWTVEVTTSFGGDPTNIFREGDMVNVGAVAFDQYGNPYAPMSYFSASYNVTRDGEFWSSGTLNFYWYMEGEATASFYVWESGEYVINVYNNDRDLGNAAFTVVYLEISIAPQRFVYSQGQTITIEVLTSLQGTYTVNITDGQGVVVSGGSWTASGETWLRDYAIPATLADGQYRISVWQSNREMGNTFFNVQRFSLRALTDKDVYLPGEQITLFFTATSNLDNSPLSVTVEVELQYRRNTGDWTTLDVGTRTGSSSSFSFRMPTDAMEDRQNTLFVHADTGAGHTADRVLYPWCGSLVLQTNTDSATYAPGDPMVVGVRAVAQASGQTSPVNGVEINVRGTKDDANLPWLSENLVTGTDGRASVLVQIPEGAEDGLCTINFTGVFSTNRNVKTNALRDFNIDSEPDAYIVAEFGKTTYVSGETVELSYWFFLGDEKTTGLVSYVITLDGVSIAAGHSSDGTITVQTPEDIEGWLTVEITGMTGDNRPVATNRQVQIHKARITAYAAMDSYMPGETIVFTYKLVGDSAQTAVCTITDSRGETVSITNPTGETVSFPVPVQNPSNTYTATFRVEGERNVYQAAANSALRRGYMVAYSTDKNYYSPGETVTFTFTITPIGDPVEAASGFTIKWGMAMEQQQTTWTSARSGSVTMNIPANIQDGVYLVQLQATSAGANMMAEGAGIKVITVDTQAGGLMYGSTAGMATGTFLALVLAIVAIVLALVLGLRGRKGPKQDALPPGAAEGEQFPPQEPSAPENYQQPPPPPEPFAPEQSSQQYPEGMEQPAPQPTEEQMKPEETY